MRNLHLLRNVALRSADLNNLSYCFIGSELLPAKTTEIFALDNRLNVSKIYLTSDALSDPVIITNLPELLGENLQEVSVVECNCVYGNLYIILSSGHLVTILNKNYEDTNISVKEFGVGSLVGASWSPDFERTVVINSGAVLSVLAVEDDEFETVTTVSLQDSSEEQNKLVNVGWGSVETQFRGSEGKYSKSSTIVKGEENLENDAFRICWKQSSTAFAVSYICCEERVRKIKVFNHDGVLLNITKGIHGLQPACGWCPSKNLIACVQTLPNKQVVCFMEENALRHGDFELCKHTEVAMLLWNFTGSILACHGKANEREFIALWVTSNYKWFMKQKLEFDEHLSCIQWDHSSPNKLHVILQSGIYRIFEWQFQIDQSSRCHCPSNQSLVSVINERQVNITPYRSVIMPPSIPHKSYEAPENVNAVVFPYSAIRESENYNCNSMLLYLSSNAMLLLKYEDVDDRLYFTFALGESKMNFSTPLEFSTWLWLLPDKLFFGWARPDETATNYFCVANLNFETKSITITETYRVKSSIIAICSYQLDVIFSLDDGSVFLYRHNEIHPLDFHFVEPCIRVEALNEETLILMSENRNLYVNDEIKWRDVLSFYWKCPFLVVVTMDSRLLITKVSFAAQAVEFSEVSGRTIEPKSYLVTVVDDTVFLETERGNLETITPRPFIIYKMEEKLKDADYFEVFRMLRKQRINSNVIYDRNPDDFLANVNKIVEDVSDPQYLLTFITELENENVAKKMFPWKYGDAKSEENKVMNVCSVLESEMKSSNSSKIIRPLIAALVRQDKLAEAALYATENHEIQTLFHLADTVAVYHAALAADNLRTALAIIENSKLDPSEYLPFIHELQELEEHYRKHKIFDYLEDREKALYHLAHCEEEEKFEECLKYVCKHKLYLPAVQIYGSKSDSFVRWKSRKAEIFKLAAQFCLGAQLYEEAAALFEKIGLQEKALSCYLAVGNCFSAVSVIKSLNCDESKKLKLFEDVYEKMRKRGQYKDAAFVACNYLSNAELTAKNYLLSKKYSKAMDAVRGLRDEDVIETVIRPHLVEDVKIFEDNLQSDLTNLSAYVNRLKIVREKLTNSNTDEVDDRMSYLSSDGSDANSVSSYGSRTSVSSTAKRARKREKKLWNLKPGNPREEPALLNAIHEILQKGTKQYGKLIPELLKALVKADELRLAQEMKLAYKNFLAASTQIRNKIWPLEEIKEEGGVRDIQLRCPPDVVENGWELQI